MRSCLKTTGRLPSFVLCKLFSGVLLGRIRPVLEALQDPEQGGFRPDYSCSDVVMFMRMISEKADEWGEEVWAASLDLEKAFDKVYHTSVIDALMDAGIDADVIRFLWQCYRQNSAYVALRGDSKSRVFDILRGVRQGDPMSPVLFNNVTRKVYAKLREHWARKGFGTIVCSGPTANSTHTMFADDTTLFASNKAQLKSMIEDVRDKLAKHGLSLNMDKCLVQTSRPGASLIPMEIPNYLLSIELPIVLPIGLPIELPIELLAAPKPLRRI